MTTVDETRDRRQVTDAVQSDPAVKDEKFWTDDEAAEDKPLTAKDLTEILKEATEANSGPAKVKPCTRCGRNDSPARYPYPGSVEPHVLCPDCRTLAEEEFKREAGARSDTDQPELLKAAKFLRAELLRPRARGLNIPPPEPVDLESQHVTDIPDKPDFVNSPPHYNCGEVETIDGIEAAGHLEGFCAGSALKYLWRYRHKGKPIEDLKKARWYLNKLIGHLENQGLPD